MRDVKETWFSNIVCLKKQNTKSGTNPNSESPLIFKQIATNLTHRIPRTATSTFKSGHKRSAEKTASRFTKYTIIFRNINLKELQTLPPAYPESIFRQ